MKILLKIRYDGSAYCGFQTQPNGTSVQQVLTDAFSGMLGFRCNITGCSRTDSGVHALSFCAALEPADVAKRGNAWCPIPIGKIHRAINAVLPQDIAVVAASSLPDDFHPRYNVRSKTYEYHITDTPFRDPFLYGRVYHAPFRISQQGVTVLENVASLFVGQHDFSGYMTTGSKITDARRTVYSASVRRGEDGILVYSVEANGFLYNMVRIMAGTLLDCACGRKNMEDAKQALETGCRKFAGFTAPPQGLYLCDVRYDREIDWQCQ